MSALGDRINRITTAGDLFRAVINVILEEKMKRSGGQTLPVIMIISDVGTILLSHAEPVITTTTSLTDVWDSATADYEVSEYS